MIGRLQRQIERWHASEDQAAYLLELDRPDIRQIRTILTDTFQRAERGQRRKSRTRKVQEARRFLGSEPARGVLGLHSAHAFAGQSCVAPLEPWQSAFDGWIESNALCLRLTSSLRRPSKASCMKRSCQRQTQVLDLPIRRMISFMPAPFAERRTTSARHACF